MESHQLTPAVVDPIAELLPAGLNQIPYAVDVKGRSKLLSVQQRLFVYYYLADPDHCAVNAAARAGYVDPGAQGSRLMLSPRIRACIEAKLDTLISGREVLERLADHARGDITWLDDCYQADDQGRRRLDLKKVRKLGLGCLIKAIKPGPWGDTVELYDASKALELLGRFHKLFVDRMELGTEIDWDKLSDEDLDRLARRKLK